MFGEACGLPRFSSNVARADGPTPPNFQTIEAHSCHTRGIDDTSPPSTAKAASILLVQPPCSACKCFEESRSTEATSSGVLARGVWLEQRGENGMDIGANSQCHAGVS